MEENGLNELLIGLYLTLGFYAIARTNYFISQRNKNWGILIHWILHLINLIVYFYILSNLFL
jgi:ABC-type multidrug transport system permease subunit